MLTNLARSNEANDLDFRLKDFFQALIKANVNPTNILHTRMDHDDYLELRKLFRTSRDGHITRCDQPPLNAGSVGVRNECFAESTSEYSKIHTTSDKTR
ncbi:hypothetical protein F441_06065, partial [Phytophthora nicotianae CJ01A1]